MSDMSGKFDVGYGKPPLQHRFQKGRSGNPNGRPRGAKNKPKPFDPALQPTDGLILEEAYRPVSIREGDKVIELPAIQAAVRALAISAMKGSPLVTAGTFRAGSPGRESQSQRAADHDGERARI